MSSSFKRMLKDKRWIFLHVTLALWPAALVWLCLGNWPLVSEKTKDHMKPKEPQ